MIETFVMNCSIISSNEIDNEIVKPNWYNLFSLQLFKRSLIPDIRSSINHLSTIIGREDDSRC